MKNNALLFALFLVLSGQSVFAQRILSPSLRPYAANWTYTLVKSMHYAGFDMPAMPVTPATKAVQPRSGALQLDSTKTYYGYSVTTPGDSTPLFRTHYQYPQPNVRIEINYQYENGTWLPLNRATVFSDDQQRIVETYAEVFDPAFDDFRPDSKLEVFPRGDSPDLIDSFFTWGWDTGLADWKPLFSTKNIFDDDDRLLQSFSQVDYFGDPLIFRDDYYYDTNGDNHLIESVAILGNDEFPGGRTVSSYYEHLPIEVAFYIYDGPDTIPQSRANMAYTTFGAMRRRMDFEWDAEKDAFRMNQTIDYTYDFAQRLSLKETAFLPLNAHEEREMVVYSYVDDENLAVEFLLFWNDDLFDWKLDSKKWFYYNTPVSVDPTPGPALSLKVSPNPTTGFVRFSFEDEASVRVFDAAGQLVQSRQMQSNQSLDMSLLPAGIYTVTAQLGSEFYSGRVVRQ